MRYRRQQRNRGSSRRQRPDYGSEDGAAQFAAIDLGTNSCRMLIARTTDNPPNDCSDFTVIDGFSRIVRLGEGLASAGHLNPAAMTRTIDALSICADKIRTRGVNQVCCVATEACRRAANREIFVERIAKETGLKMEVISPDREAALTLGGCVPLIDPQYDRALLIDIGGGSTEVQWLEVTADTDSPKTLDMVSLPIGVVSLAEEFGTGMVEPRARDLIIDRVKYALAPFSERNGIADYIAADRVQMMGTSGTVTTLGALNLGLSRYDRDKVDGLVLDFESIQTHCRELSGLDEPGRRDIPCIGKGRADLMLMGCALLGGIIESWPVGALKIADRGIREGLLREMMRDYGRRQNPEPADKHALPLSVSPAV